MTRAEIESLQALAAKATPDYRNTSIEANSAYIAACSPEFIAELCQMALRYDRAEAALVELQNRHAVLGQKIGALESAKVINTFDLMALLWECSRALVPDQHIDALRAQAGEGR